MLFLEVSPNLKQKPLGKRLFFNKIAGLLNLQEHLFIEHLRVTASPLF